MRRKKGVNRPVIQYSEAFKLTVVREVEDHGETFEAVRRKYGIRGSSTLQKWVRRYGRGIRGKIIRVHTPKEIDELQSLRQEVKRLKLALADAHMDIALEQGYVRIACRKAGIADVEEF
jgi:transposase-like protein